MQTCEAITQNYCTPKIDYQYQLNTLILSCGHIKFPDSHLLLLLAPTTKRKTWHLKDC